MITAGVLDEPLLEFAHGQRLEHPVDGLFLHGPVDTPGRPGTIHLGVVGTPEGVALATRWLSTIRGRIPSEDPDALHTADWPGFETVFGARLPPEPLATLTVPRIEVENAIRRINRTDAVRSTVRIFEDAIKEHLRRDERRPHVWLVIVPEAVFAYGRPEVRGPKDATASTLMPERTAQRILGSPSMFPQLDEEATTYLFSKNFHHQLKAQLLGTDAVLQLLRETTIDPGLDLDRFGNPKRSLQEAARLTWNIATTLFFKANGQPWQLAGVRPGVCYVGTVFKLDTSAARRGEACCAAQMFLKSGNGVVFKGALGPWYSEEKREFHLSSAAAADLIAEVLEGYRGLHGGEAPRELFIHGRQRFNDDEWAGFRKAVGAGVQLAGVRIRSSPDLRLFRPDATKPVLRGTWVACSRREGYLWTTGFTPRLGTYPGFETPKPLKIDIHHGEADLLTVMRDVLGLTKINYNSCDFSSGLPVTLKFADLIGDILMASPNAMKAPPLPFRFYI